MSFSSRYALTLGEQSEIHVGCPITGDGLVEEGFTVEELKEFSEKFDEVQFIKLHKKLPREVRDKNRAAVLVIRNGINLIMKDEEYANKMFEEQHSTEYDKFYFDNRRKKKLNKIARHNAIFGDEGKEHSEDYSQSTVISYDDVPLFKKLRKKLPKYFGDKAKNLNSEGNHYYQKSSGIGLHGDSERKIVICCCLGSSTTLVFKWREPRSSECFGKPFEFELNHGDIYIMSEKTTGWDWKKRSSYRLVHAAGNEKYTKV